MADVAVVVAAAAWPDIELALAQWAEMRENPCYMAHMCWP